MSANILSSKPDSLAKGKRSAMYDKSIAALIGTCQLSSTLSHTHSSAPA